MRYQLKAVLDDGQELDASVDGRDVRKWEGAHSATFIGIELSYGILTELAFYALKRTGAVDMNWADFDAACIGIEHVEDAPAPKATSKGRGGKPRSR